jgi:hypothetical protein
LVGDEETIEKTLFGKQVSSEDISLNERWKLDAKMRRAALATEYDSILLMSSKAFFKLKAAATRPHCLELNILDVRQQKARRRT